MAEHSTGARLWTDSAPPWLWEQQLSSLLGIPMVQMAQSLLLTRYVMAFCPPSLYFIHFKVVNKGQKGSECFHTQTERFPGWWKSIFPCTEEVAVKTQHAAAFGFKAATEWDKAVPNTSSAENNLSNIYPTLSASRRAEVFRELNHFYSSCIGMMLNLVFIVISFELLNLSRQLRLCLNSFISQ